MANVPPSRTAQLDVHNVGAPHLEENSKARTETVETGCATAVPGNAQAEAASSNNTLSALNQPPPENRGLGESTEDNDAVQEKEEKQKRREEKQKRKEEKRRRKEERKREKKRLEKEAKKALKESETLENSGSDDLGLDKQQKKKTKTGMHVGELDQDAEGNYHNGQSAHASTAEKKRKLNELDGQSLQGVSTAEMTGNPLAMAESLDAKRRKVTNPPLILPDVANVTHSSKSNSDNKTPHASEELVDSPKSQLSNNPADQYGSPIVLEASGKGCFATRYYPHRSTPLHVPTGKLTPEAKTERYKDLTEVQIKERQTHYEEQSAKYPKVFQDAFKHTERGRLDKYPHLWLIPRLHNYFYTSRDGRTALLDRIIRDLIQEFPDLHPNFLKLRDVTMEKEYLAALRNVVFVAISGIKGALENPTKVENIDKDVVKHLTGAMVPLRPHDLWAKAELAKPKEEATDADQVAGETAPLTESPSLQDQWEAVFDEAKKTHGVKAANRTRLKLEQKFRKQKFDQLPAAEKKFWNDLAAESEKPVDPTTALATGLPFVNLVNKRFSDLAQVPMVILMGAPDPSNPGKILVYHDTYSPAPSGVADFFNGPDQFGPNVVVPAFRRWLAQCYNAQHDDVANAGIPLPTASTDDLDESSLEQEELEPRIQVSSTDGPAGAVSRLGVRFTVTPPPKIWAAPSKELEAIKKNIKAYLSDSFKKAHNKRRIHFSTLGTRAEDYVDLSLLPTTKIIPVLLPDGTTIFKEGDDKQIVYPADPLAMLWYQAKAYYDLLKDPDCRFQWRIEQQGGSSRLQEPPASLQNSFKRPQDPHASSTQRDPAKTTSLQPPSRNPLGVNCAVNLGQAPRTSHMPSGPSGAQESEPEAESSAQSADSSPFSVGTESSLGEPYQPQTEYVLRQESVSRFGRRSAPAAPRGLPLPPNTSPAAPAQASHTSNDEDSLPDAVPICPGKNQDICPTDVTLRYAVKPAIEPDAINVLFDSLVEHVRELALPTAFEDEWAALPNLPTLLKHCAKLDALFPARSPQPLSPPVLDLLWDDLNDPQKPVPTLLAATQFAFETNTTIDAIVKQVANFLLAMLDILEGHDMVESVEPQSLSFVSWTDYLLLMARYLKFAESINPADDYSRTEEFSILHERILELAVIHLVVRYCAEAVASHISDHPAPSSCPSIANAISTLGKAWIELLRRTCCPINKTVLPDILGESWAYAVDPLCQPPDSNPFFHLAIPSERWFMVVATETLYDAIEKLEVQLHSQPNLLDTMSVYQQFTLLASIFAIHGHEDIRGTDEAWLSIVDFFLERMENSNGGGMQYEIEIAPLQPPPTLAPSAPKPYAKPRHSTSRTKSTWALGDVGLVDINGKQEEVIFVRKQKYGSTSGYLVMARQDPIREITAMDGESELPLPEFDPGMLVRCGPTNPVETTHLRVPGFNLGRNLGISDMMKPEYAGYFAQFRDVADDVDPIAMEQRGFKPPEYFAKVYFESLPKHTAEQSVPPHPTSSNPNVVALPANSTNVAQAAHGSDGQPPAPTEHDYSIPPVDSNPLPIVTRDSEAAEGADTAGHLSEEVNLRGPIVKQGLRSRTLAQQSSERREENGRLDGEEFEGDEEEVENVLSAGKKGLKSKGAPKTKGTGPAPRVPKKATATKDAKTTKKQAVTPVTKGDSGPSTRASTRNRNSGSNETDTPAQANRRVSTRIMTAQNASNYSSGSATKRSEKK
ncbi:hypothetical protein FRC05_009840 [Tulasnella sp. 425]|nr:hypothetical protein FRC05_009840 [Tulasnella sp. 425]